MDTPKSVDFGPIEEKLVGMIGASRDAFNRHSRTGLDQFKNLEEAAAKEIDAALKKVEGQIAQAKTEDKAQLKVRHDVFKGLQRILETLEGLWEPINKKMKGNILFSEKAVSQTNGLLDSQAGLLRSVFDILQTDNDYLKKFVQEEGSKIQRDCFDFATEHETRLIEGLCTSQAAPIFLAILEQVRSLGKQEVEFVQNLMKQ